MEINFRKINMERIIDYKVIASLSDDMKKLIVDVALEAYLDGLSDGVNIEAGLEEDSTSTFISELATEINFKL
jgi:hypothetical protein